MSLRDSKLLGLIDSIPNVRDGKGDHAAMSSFVQDIKTYKIFVRRAKALESKAEFAAILKRWDEFVQMRHNEDWCAYSQSKTGVNYPSMFKP